jgi:hypothetical protein
MTLFMAPSAVNYVYLERLTSGLTGGYGSVPPRYEGASSTTGVVGTELQHEDYAICRSGTSTVKNAFNYPGPWSDPAWSSTALGNAISGSEYIGQNFGFPAKITTITLKAATTEAATASSIKIQSSNDGSTWTDHNTESVVYNTTNTYTVTSPTPKKQWRILANANLPYSYNRWSIRQITMSGIMTDQHWFNLNDFKMYYIDSSATWTEKARVFVGEVTTNGTSVTAIKNYALLGLYDSGWLGYVPTLLNSTGLSHNVGQIPISHPILYFRETGSNIVCDSAATVKAMDTTTIKFNLPGATTFSQFRVILTRGW